MPRLTHDGHLLGYRTGAGTLVHYTTSLVVDPNVGPTAAFTTTTTGLTVDVDATTSTDTDGTITAYAWNFGDGNTGTGATATHTYAAGGAYTITLTVTDDDGAGNAATTTVNPTEPVATTAPLAGDYSLTFADEFDAATLDTTKWTPNYIWGGDAALATLAGEANPPTTNVGNSELQAYVPEANTLTGGRLRITADRTATPVTAYGDTNGTTYPSSAQDYTSGLISGHGKYEFLYGLVEFTAKMPAHNGGKGGFWPAVWLLAASRTWPPEVDIFEWASKSPHQNTMWMNNIFNFDPWSNQGIHTDAAADWSGQFHHFALDWQPTHMRYYIDGVLRHEILETDQIPNVPMYLLANFAVGGIFLGAGANEPEVDTPFPAHFELEYVRVWRLPEYVPPVEDDPVTGNLIDDFTGTDGAAWNTAIWKKSTNTTPTWSIQGNKGRLHTGTVGGYANGDKIQVRTLTSYTAGEVRGSITFTDLTEARIAFAAYIQGTTVANYMFYPQSGYYVDYETATGNLWLRKTAGEAVTTLVTTTATALLGGNPSIGDTWHIVIAADATNGVRATVWKAGATRPAANLVPGTIDTTYTAGYVGAGMQGGSSAVARTVDLDNVTHGPQL